MQTHVNLCGRKLVINKKIRTEITCIRNEVPKNSQGSNKKQINASIPSKYLKL